MQFLLRSVQLHRKLYNSIANGQVPGVSPEIHGDIFGVLVQSNNHF